MTKAKKSCAIEIKDLIKIFNSVMKLCPGQIIDAYNGPRTHLVVTKPGSSCRINELRTALDTKGVFTECENDTGNLIFEFPKQKQEKTELKAILKSKEFTNQKSILPIALGVYANGQPAIMDLATMPHLLIAGRVGTGKTVLLKSIIKSIATKKPDYKLMLVDTKNQDFRDFNDKHLIAPVATKPHDALDGLLRIVNLLDERYLALKHCGVRNIFSYNKKNPRNSMPFVIVIIDEFADLIAKSAPDFEIAIQEIAQKGRAVGIHLVMATQRIEAISNLVLANMPVRIAFQTKSANDSNAIIDESWAKDLLPFGDALLADAGRMPKRIHTAI